ncbi:MAG: hypothetical protein QOJ40_3080 [Verrucomicrobiota bacterium]
MIWLLAFLLLASLAALGYRQGAIRVSFSLVGILIGALLAGWLGRFIKPILSGVGISNPILLWLLAPLLVFIAVSAIFKIVALNVHNKVDVHYKYQAGDLRLTLWERLNHRLGACLGLLNGTLYFLLITLGIFILSYWTVQMGSAETDPAWLKLLNHLGRDLHGTGIAKASNAIAPMPQAYYDTADVAGLVYNNPLLEARLSRYPAFLGLAERPELKEIANDKEFTEMRQRQEPMINVIRHPKVQAVINNHDLLTMIWNTLTPDLKDLRAYLETGISPKYDNEKILGRWDFNVNSALSLLRRAKPNLTSSDMQKYKKWMVVAFSKTTLVAAPNGQAILKSMPPLPSGRPAAASQPQTLEGQWKNLDGKYELTFSGGGRQEDMMATVDGDRMSITNTQFGLAFEREN